MMDALIRWSLHHRAAIIAMALVLTALGVSTARRMPVDVHSILSDLALGDLHEVKARIAR